MVVRTWLATRGLFPDRPPLPTRGCRRSLESAECLFDARGFGEFETGIGDPTAGVADDHRVQIELRDTVVVGDELGDTRDLVRHEVEFVIVEECRGASGGDHRPRRRRRDRCESAGLVTDGIGLRAADPDRGRPIYLRACAGCHLEDGAGVLRSVPNPDFGYVMPPLWGPDSFNDGAGMSRLITAANFVHLNMPHGTDYLNPQLTPEQAWDVAAYMVSQPRPQKAGLDKDFPNLLDKPVDTPYGPYADGFSAQQHKYGPFAPIREAIARMKAAQPGGRAPAR